MSLTLWKSPRLKFQIGREAHADVGSCVSAYSCDHGSHGRLWCACFSSKGALCVRCMAEIGPCRELPPSPDAPGLIFDFDFSLEKPATRPRDRCGKEQLVYPFVTGFPGSSRVSALAPYSSGDRVGSTLSTPHAGGDLGLFVGECSSPQTDAPNDDQRVRLMSLTQI